MKNECLNELRKKVWTLLLVGLSTISLAQDTIMYHGGYHDGYAATGKVNFTPANLNGFVAYQGGKSDGYGADSKMFFTPSKLSAYAPYLGGGQDGYVSGNLNQFTPALLSTQAMYLGASGDGYGKAAQANFTPALLTHHYMYMGNSSDGYANGSRQQFAPAYLTQFTPYAGGAGDGYAGSLIVGVVLPVHLLSFEGKATERGNLLEWKVSLEKSLKSYELQRGSDGIRFGTIYTTGISGNAAQKKSYDYLDTQVQEGDNYYRLQINELNGGKSFSNVVLLVHKKDKQLLSIYPNPAQDVMTLQYRLDGKTMMRITDMKGSIISEQQLEQGEHTIRIPVAQLAQGMYLLQVASETNFNKSIRFIKQ